MENSAKVYTAGTWTVTPGKAPDFIAAWKRFAEASVENQPSTSTDILLQDVEDENIFRSFGEWDSIESINAWRETGALADFMAIFRQLCDDMQIRTTKPVAIIGKGEIAA